MGLEPRWRPETIWPRERRDSGRKGSPGKGSEKPKQSGGVGEGTRAGVEEEAVPRDAQEEKRIWARKFLPTVSRTAGQKLSLPDVHCVKLLVGVHLCFLK